MLNRGHLPHRSGVCSAGSGHRLGYSLCHSPRLVQQRRRAHVTDSRSPSPTGAVLAENQARFVNLDGKVEVKKVNSVNWESADYHTTLDKGDLVHTTGDGAARITFVKNGTTYAVRTIPS